MRYHVGGFTGQTVIPQIGFEIAIPEAMDGKARTLRAYKKISMEALEFCLKFHHLRTMPEHFKATNRNKYRHKERSSVYKKVKKVKFRSITDLVKTGKSKAYILGIMPPVKHIRNLPEGVQAAKMEYRWPFNKSGRFRDAGKNRVKIEDMNEELTTMTHEESMRMVELYRDRWVRGWEKEFSKIKQWKKKQSANSWLQGI